MIEKLLPLGAIIGSGNARVVHSVLGHEDLVVKIARSSTFENVNEWMLWNSASPRQRQLLADCLGILDEGRMLIMRRTQELRPSQFDRIPRFGDRHPGNFGWLSGRLVCHDYGLLDLPSLIGALDDQSTLI